MTLFSFEVPLAHIKDFEEVQDFTFALSFLLYASEDYSDYVRLKCKDPYETVYIDNSFNETNVPIATQEMARIFYAYHPSAVIAPDADWWQTKDLLSAYDDLTRYVDKSRV